MLPHFLSQLIDQGLIDEEESTNPEYLWTIVRENLFNYDVLSDPPVIFSLPDKRGMSASKVKTELNILIMLN